MGLGLKALNRFAGSSAIDKLGLRKLAERGLYQSTRAGFVVAGKAGRSFNAAQKLLSPARLPRAAGTGLFDLTPTTEQEMLRDAAQSFAHEQLRPAAAAADRNSAAPATLLQESAALGFAVLGIPEAFGGAGNERSAVTNVLIAAALAEGDLSLAVACLAPGAVATALSLWGNEAQQAQYLPAFAADNAPTAALAVQEPQPLFDAFALRTSAARRGDGYVLNGIKSLVPRGADCELFVVAAQLDGSARLFLVESKTKGISLRAEPAMGLRAAATAQLTLQEVSLGADALLGSVEDYGECIALSRLAWCALAAGCGKAVLDHVIPYANERIAFGEPISHRQAVAFMIADISVELEGLRLATCRAAAKAERGEDFVVEAAIARQLATDKAVRIGNDGVQVLGGHGFTKEYPVERWYRDLRACGFMEGVLLV
ncbi:MAG: acyl-CoA dehydrogenase family protein [Pseudomonadota bacterium]